jgi:hypothetical protein
MNLCDLPSSIFDPLSSIFEGGKGFSVCSALSVVKWGCDYEKTLDVWAQSVGVKSEGRHAPS